MSPRGISPIERGLPFFLPLCTLAFLATGPHAWDVALGWTWPVWLCVAVDVWGPRARCEENTEPSAFLIYPLFALQWANIGLMLNHAASLSFDSPARVADAVAGIAALRILTGTTSCCSGIALAHELIHRRARHQRWMGRILLWTVLYDHFAIEHVRGHHRYASTAADPATARYGESFSQFWPRAVKGQWASAWRLENERLARLPRRWRWLYHRVIHGILIQGALLGSIAILFGPIALGVFLYQAYAAVKLLETVNYFQHWGLSRAGARFSAADAWATDAWFSQLIFFGLAQHADHHQGLGNPHGQRDCAAESPRLPCGYFGLALLIKVDDGRFRALASRELRACKLGPYARALGQDSRAAMQSGSGRPASPREVAPFTSLDAAR
jgi:alkane 1-monooxygenase